MEVAPLLVLHLHFNIVAVDFVTGGGGASIDGGVSTRGTGRARVNRVGDVFLRRSRGG